MQVPALTMAVTLLSQAAVTWAYKHPDIKWINKDNIRLVSIFVSSVGAVGTAYATGTLDDGVVENAIQAAYDAFVASGMAVAFYEWTKEPKAQ